MIETYDLSNPLKPTIGKDPDAVLDYSENWAAWLAQITDTILSVTVDAESPLIVQGEPTFGGGVVSAMIGGGTLGKTHRVTFTIFTAGSRKDQRSIYLRMIAR